MRFIVTVLFCLIVPGDVSGAPLPSLPDQFGFSRGLNQAASPVLVIVVDARRLRRIKKWETALLAHYPDLDILRVADVPRDPPAELATVTEQLRKRVPAGVSVTIDLEGRWSDAFALDVSEPSLLVFSFGELTAKHDGPYSTVLLEAVLADLYQLSEGPPLGQIE